MTLPLLSRGRSEAPLKLKVSRHVACSWDWTMTYDIEDSDFVVELHKCHPVWSFVEELLSHLPSWLGPYVYESGIYRQLEEKHSAKVARISIPPQLAKQLYFPLWEVVDEHQQEGEEE